MIYLINRVCYLPHRIERLLLEFGINYKIVTEQEWYSQLQFFQFLRSNNMWLHIWDDHPFMCGREFQDALRKKIIPGINNIFVVYNDSYRLNLWHDQLDQDIKEKSGYMYSSSPEGTIDYDELHSHIFIINSETNENFNDLVLAIHKLEERLRC